ncbi:monocarboxylate transporter 9-like [Octopus vulgaris]|uniref:Monocarboxylate transporter 9-like n=1 Tax=Octopus vulgaris TaxID=6645 RepID=A0AA36BMU8_OCTVU|nr:monocarboxylate transporter 9-like [Octopus vulgaris]
MILSGFIGCTGAILGAFSASSDMMIITYGLISGLSTGIAFFACHIITGLYFDKKRALAIGIINCGGGVGLMLMSLFLEHFIEFYGLRGVLVDLFHISSNKMYIFSMLVLTICVIMVPHCDKFEYITPVICLFGLANGFSVSLRLILTTEISGLEHATKAYSILSFINGISYFAAPPLFGLIFDTTNSLLAVYYGGGACALTGLLLFLIIVCRNTFYKKRLKK